MKKLIKTNEEKVFKTIRMEGVKVSYSDEEENHVLTHTIIKSNPSIAIIVKKEGKIALIKQFRSSTGETYIEIPAGIINDGENEIDAAIRETQEETGYVINNVSVLVKGPSLLDPSKSNENYGVAVGDVCGQCERMLDETEEIDSEIIWMDEKEVFERVKAQMYKGEFFKDNLFMTGHSLYAIMAYMLV